MTDPLVSCTTPSTPDADERMEAVRAAAEGLFDALGHPVPLTGRVWIICDTCGAAGPEADTLGGALAMRPPGWRHTNDGADYCADCGHPDAPRDSAVIAHTPDQLDVLCRTVDLTPPTAPREDDYR